MKHPAPPHGEHAPPPNRRDSVLCASAGQRLGIVSIALLALWLTVHWALK